ncbi:hypothetical protein BDQ17DRAFT_1500346 [Cyathus striatus]|nr:hypothetical protein BDQ17DRAFT_1500346 [Cyathus striatus]
MSLSDKDLENQENLTKGLHESSTTATNTLSSLLPSPATHSAKTKPKLSVATIIPIWIILSSAMIIYNNYIYNTLNFKFPVFLVTWHLTFAAVGMRILQRTTRLLDGVKEVHMTKEMFVKSILPIGVLFSGSLVLSNTAYLYLSVYAQVAILLITWITCIDEPNKKLLIIVLMISSGVALASQGELRFNLVGFLIQAAAVAPPGW